MHQKLKCGIVGYGYMGEIRRGVIERHPQLELAAICEVDPNKSGAIVGVPVFDSFNSLLESEINILFICTPNKFSPSLCIAGLEKGKHVFCEKPPGRNLEDIMNIRRAERPETKLMFGFNHRFHPGIMKAKVIVESGRLGRILGMRGVYGKSGGRSYPASWRNSREISGGGILLDQGIHMLDLFCHFCGDFEKVKCLAATSFWNFDVEDNAFVVLQNGQGQLASLHSSATLWKHTFQLDIILEDGYLSVEGFLSRTGSYGREKLIVGKRQFEDEAAALGNPSEEVTYFDQDKSWELEVEEFVNCILKDKPVTMGSSQDAIRVMALIDKAYGDARGETEGKRHENYYLNRRLL